MKEKKKLSLAAQIFIAMVLAIVFGLAMQSCAEFANNFIKPFGTIFLNLVKFIVVPIVLFSIMCGIISMSDIRKVGSIGLKTVIYYLVHHRFRRDHRSGGRQPVQGRVPGGGHYRPDL